jgi:hypothetical protein
MLTSGPFKLLFDTVDEGVLVTVHDDFGFVCQVVDRDARRAAEAALEAAEASLLVEAA